MADYTTRLFYFPQKGFRWHKEDSWRVSKKAPIFAVADGVTIQGFGELFMPSGSKRAADAFCEAVISVLESRYPRVDKQDFTSAYSHANKAVHEINTKEKTKLSTVGCVVVLEEEKILGSRITDCGFTLLRKGRIVFKTPEFWSWLKRTRKNGYGVVDGKQNVVRFINFYTKPFLPGDILLLFSDGFEQHFYEKQFLLVFKERGVEKISRKLKLVDAKLVEKNSDRFGHERTLLMIML